MDLADHPTKVGVDVYLLFTQGRRLLRSSALHAIRLIQAVTDRLAISSGGPLYVSQFTAPGRH
jgi:hypothetical protein